MLLSIITDHLCYEYLEYNENMLYNSVHCKPTNMDLTLQEEIYLNLGRLHFNNLS